MARSTGYRLLLLMGLLSLPLPVSAKTELVSSIDLSKPFVARSPWQFTATQGPDVEDPNGPEGETAPGALSLCISKDKGQSCTPDIQHGLRLSRGEDFFEEPHYLNDARIVYPRPGMAMLLLQTGSFHSMNGDQRVATQALTYDRGQDGFAIVYSYRTNRNNNQEIRYIESGALKGDIVSAEPTDDAPFGFWITVNALASSGRYAQILHYRSATRYGDGNPLAVIDSEMPAIQQKLGKWAPGSPLPVPKGKCPMPHLVRGALWCE